MTKNKKEFIKKLQGLSQSRSAHQVFSDWLEIAAISMHQLPYHSGDLARDNTFERLEQSYMRSIKPYGREELIVFSEMLTIVISSLGSGMGYSDFLGEIAGEAELLNKGGGQFFTPYHLCRAIAKMTLGDVYQSVREKGIITVCEPAVGSGSLVIASAEEIDMQAIDPRAHVQFDCTDISRDAFNMAYIQLSALGLQSVVRHGNTLSNEYWEHRPTPQLRLFEQWLAPQRRAAQLAQAMQSILAGTSSAEPEVRDSPPAYEKSSGQTLFDLEPFAGESLTRKRSTQKPDVVLDRQMDLFG